MFTDTEIALLQTNSHNMRDAQRVVDRQDAAIDEAHGALALAYAEIRRLRAELTTERAARQAADLKVEALKKLARSLA